MALIKSFKPIGADSRGQVHRTEVDCGWAFFTIAGRTYLQLDTYGSQARAIPGKVSQTLQLDEDAARELKRLIIQAFPGL